MNTRKKVSTKVRERHTESPAPFPDPQPVGQQTSTSGLTGEGAQSALDQLLAQERKARLNKPRK